MPAIFTKALQEMNIIEKEPVTLECETNKPTNNVEWSKDGEKIKQSKRHKRVSKGRRHLLHILDTIPEDEGEYEASIGNEKTSARLNVEGIIRNEKSLILFKYIDLIVYCSYLRNSRRIYYSPSR